MLDKIVSPGALGNMYLVFSTAICCRDCRFDILDQFGGLPDAKQELKKAMNVMPLKKALY